MIKKEEIFVLPNVHTGDFIVLSSKFSRNLFGGSVGPIRKQLPNGQFQNVYEGVKLRAQPLPLRVPTSPQTVSQQQAQVFFDIFYITR